MSPIMIAGLCGQWIGAIAVVIGICYEKKYKAHWGFVAITAGGLIWGMGTKLLGF